MSYRQLPWMANVKVGSVLISGGGTARIVRRVSREGNGNLRYVYFTIRHCSWTGRCYTLVSANDLIQYQYRPAGFTYRIPSDEFNQTIEKCLDGDERLLTCCQVRGVR